MANKEVKTFRLNPDRPKTRKAYLNEVKLSGLHEPNKVYKNPKWPIDLEDLVVVSDVYYNLDEIVKILDEAGENLGKPSANRMEIETKLAIDLHEYLKDIPRKILFDNKFWFYLTLSSPVYHVHRYDTSKNKQDEHKSADRLWGDWRRTPISAAYLSYYLANEVGVTATEFENVGSRLRMWILDQTPLISKKLRKAYVLKLISVGKGQDSHLMKGGSWSKVPEQLGSINLDMLDETEVNSLVDRLF